eukprot:7113498-Karenia_brevis.AAC.1
MIRWIRVNKSWQMLHGHKKKELSTTQKQDNNEEREEGTGASSSKDQSAGADPLTKDTQSMEIVAGGDS